MATTQVSAAAQKNSITLQGSAQMVSEFFFYGINSILYQRGLYPPDMFKRDKKYGLSLLVTNDPKLDKYLQPFVQQIQDWLQSQELHRIVLVVANVQTKEVIERWQFDVLASDENIENRPELPGSGGDTKSNMASGKCAKQVQKEMGDVMRQITAAVTFLPCLDEPCSFDILTYTRKDTDAPDGWSESGPCMIVNSNEVQLRSFDTGKHNVNAKVSYKLSD